MAFMVVNTGRAASRAFYLNLKRQSSILSISRHFLDNAISDFIVNDHQGKLDKIGEALATFYNSGNRDTVFGAVFHGVRPRLLYPFNQEGNSKLLSVIRDKMGIRTVFFPISDSKRMFLSELNRRLAEYAGDWQFPANVIGWKRPFSHSELRNGVEIPSVPKGKLKANLKLNLKELALDISQRTGKIHSLYKLFSEVFDTMYLLDFQKFIDEPAETFQSMAQIGNFQFTDTSLAHTKFNSLANRFLIYNPVTLQIFGKTVRFRLELEQVVELCTDWGYFKHVEFDCSKYLTETEKDLNAGVAIGVNRRDLFSLSEIEYQILTRQEFLEELFGTILPIFAANYSVVKEFYKNELYFKEVPDDLYEIFLQENHKELDNMNDLIENNKVSFV